MKAPYLATVLLIAAAAPALAQTPAPEGMQADRLKFGEASKVAELDAGKGQPARLAWSPDGKQFYVQMMDGEFGKPGAKLTHYVFDAKDGDRKEVPVEPAWASPYWTAKSGQASPGKPSFRIDLKSENRVERTVSTPMGGELARGGGTGVQPTAPVGASAAYNRQNVPVHTMRLHGQIIGEYVNSVIVPGQTFGWGPAGSGVIAYSAHGSGRLTVMDEQGTRQEVAGTRNVVFPAWSPDGTRLAWMEKDGRDTYILWVAGVSRP